MHAILRNSFTYGNNSIPSLFYWKIQEIFNKNKCAEQQRNKSQTEDENIHEYWNLHSQFAPHEKLNGVLRFVGPSQRWLNRQWAMNNEQSSEQSTKQFSEKSQSNRWNRKYYVRQFGWMRTWRNEGNYHYYYHWTHGTSDIPISLDSIIIINQRFPFIPLPFTHASCLNMVTGHQNDL